MVGARRRFREPQHLTVSLEMYRDGLCDKAFRDKSLADISEEEGRWDYATSTPGMSPSRPSNWFVASLPLFRSRARMPNGRSSSGYSPGSPSAMTRSSTWTYIRYTPRLSGGIYDPERIRTADLLRDREACWTTTPRGRGSQVYIRLRRPRRESEAPLSRSRSARSPGRHQLRRSAQ